MHDGTKFILRVIVHCANEERLMRFELPPDKVAMTNEQLLDDLRRCSKVVAPLSLTKERYNEIGVFSAAGIQRRFGSWNTALDKAGLAGLRRMNIPKEELIDDLRCAADALKTDSVTQEQYNTRGRFSSSAFVRRFSSWKAALDRAELHPSPLANFDGTDEDYFAVIEAAWRKLGRVPKRDEIRRPQYSVSGNAIRRRFGSWRRALERFVEQVEKGESHPGVVAPEASERAPDTSAADRKRTPRNVGWRLRFSVLRRDGFRCRLCGASPAIAPGVELEVDHMNPWVDGGETVLENLQTTCRRCNIGKSLLSLVQAVPCPLTTREP